MTEELWRRLAALELMLLDDPDGLPWIPQVAQAPGLTIRRVWCTIPDGSNDRLYVHKIMTPGTPADVPYLHNHGMAAAMHVLGPGRYELGWGVTSQVLGRSFQRGEWYYEMMSERSQHYVRPIGPGPIYTIMLWAAAWPPEVKADPHYLRNCPGPIGDLSDADALLQVARRLHGQYHNDMGEADSY